MLNVLRAILTWDFWFDLPISTSCPHCGGRNSVLLSELSVSAPERWSCGHCGNKYVVSQQELDVAITTVCSGCFGC